MSYRQRLRDPRWRAFRESVLDLDGRKCLQCGRGEREVKLHLHHSQYVEGRLPWEYAPSDMRTLCAGCHAAEHGIIRPPYGWHLLLNVDLGSLDGACEVCSEPIRYVFTIFHPQWGIVDVGADCCDRMTESQEASEEGRYAERANRFVKSSRWAPYGNGWRIRQKGLAIGIYPRGEGFCIYIGRRAGRLRFASQEAARRHVFGLIHEGRV